VEENGQDLITDIILALPRGTEKNPKITLVCIWGLYAMKRIQYLPSTTQKCQQLNKVQCHCQGHHQLPHVIHAVIVLSVTKKNTLKW